MLTVFVAVSYINLFKSYMKDNAQAAVHYIHVVCKNMKKCVIKHESQTELVTIKKWQIMKSAISDVDGGQSQA